MQFLQLSILLAACSAHFIYRGIGDSKIQALSPNTFTNLGQLQLEKETRVNAFVSPHHLHDTGFFGAARFPSFYHPNRLSRKKALAFPNEQFVAPFTNLALAAKVNPTTHIRVGSISNTNQRSD